MASLLVSEKQFFAIKFLVDGGDNLEFEVSDPGKKSFWNIKKRYSGESSVFFT